MTRRSCLLLSAGGAARGQGVRTNWPLQSKWPASGPNVIWKRPLGNGYSSPAIDNGTIYWEQSFLAWTPPALVGSRLYLRDRKSLLAVELGA